MKTRFLPPRVALVLLIFCAAAVQAAAPLARTSPSAWYRLMLGDFEVTVLSDGSNPLPATRLLQGEPRRIEAALQRNFLGPVVETAHNSFLVNTGSRLVLVDAGAGTMLGAGIGRLVQNLRAAGYEPEQVDDVLITHLHTDHVGGLVEGRRRVFANAVVHVDRRDAEYWLSEEAQRSAPAASQRFFTAARAALQPYIEEKRLALFEGETPVLPGVRAVPAPGHTPGHAMFLVESRGEKLLLWGDVVHVAAVQFALPDTTIAYDVDGGRAATQHRQIYESAASARLLVGGAHLPFPGLGHVRAEGTRFEWVSVELTFSLGH